MDKIMKTARLDPELGALSMAKVVTELEGFAFQLRSVYFLRDGGEKEAANKLEQKITRDLGEKLAKLIEGAVLKKKG